MRSSAFAIFVALVGLAFAAVGALLVAHHGMWAELDALYGPGAMVFHAIMTTGVVYLGFGLLCVVAAVGIHRRRPYGRWLWFLLLAGWITEVIVKAVAHHGAHSLGDVGLVILIVALTGAWWRGAEREKHVDPGDRR